LADEPSHRCVAVHNIYIWYRATVMSYSNSSLAVRSVGQENESCLHFLSNLYLLRTLPHAINWIIRLTFRIICKNLNLRKYMKKSHIISHLLIVFPLSGRRKRASWPNTWMCHTESCPKQHLGVQCHLFNSYEKQ
jgi:hypothetical protein